jgi:hypothetical protein
VLFNDSGTREYNIAWVIDELMRMIIDGTIMTEEERSTRINTCPDATLSTTDPTRTDVGLNPSLHG